LNSISYRVAKRTVNKSHILNTLNEEWGQDTVLLYLTKYYYRIAGSGGHHTIFKILIADALSRDQSGGNNSLVLSLPEGYTSDLFEEIALNLNLCTFTMHSWSIQKMRTSVLLLYIIVTIKRFMTQCISYIKPEAQLGELDKPSLLLSQEDDISFDRSYRGQPHWVFRDDESPRFRTLILDSGTNNYMDYDQSELNNYNIFIVSKAILFGFSRIKLPIHYKINRSIRKILVLSLFHSREMRQISFELGLLFMKGLLLSNFCVNQNVKAYMCSENYYLDASVMNLIGSDINVHTFSYQYANISDVGPIMMTNARTMFTFSPLFHKRWSNIGIGPKEFVDVGYIFDSSFKLVMERSRLIRKNFQNNNVKFIIAYFDENIKGKNDKYGTLHEDDHYQELSSLIKLINRDDTIAVVTKSQFQRNSSSVLFKDDPELVQAIQSDRWRDLRHGKHRNIIFPVEAAMVSDMVISHVVGATAGLEAALEGRRSILLNPHGIQNNNIEIFEQANILYDDMESALSAISFYRQDRPEYRNLGDWSPIIDFFDPFRDGQSARRLRSALESALLIS